MGPGLPVLMDAMRLHTRPPTANTSTSTFKLTTASDKLKVPNPAVTVNVTFENAVFPWEGLPMEIRLSVFSYLPKRDLLSCMRVSWAFFRIANAGQFWCSINLSNILKEKSHWKKRGFVWHTLRPAWLLARDWPDCVSPAHRASMASAITIISSRKPLHRSKLQFLLGCLHCSASNVRTLCLQVDFQHSRMTDCISKLRLENLDLKTSHFHDDHQLSKIIRSQQSTLRQLSLDNLHYSPISEQAEIDILLAIGGCTSLEHLSICGWWIHRCVGRFLWDSIDEDRWEVMPSLKHVKITADVPGVDVFLDSLYKHSAGCSSPYIDKFYRLRVLPCRVVALEGKQFRLVLEDWRSPAEDNRPPAAVMRNWPKLDVLLRISPDCRWKWMLG